jgi:hypothetical protein
VVHKPARLITLIRPPETRGRENPSASRERRDEALRWRGSLRGSGLVSEDGVREKDSAQTLDRLAKILPPSPIHRHRYHGVFAPNAPLRPLVTARAQTEEVETRGTFTLQGHKQL